ncbi:hypothetical protein Tco_1486534 [Tanacetum coccineum]
MEAYLAPTQPTQVNKITTSCEICSGPHDVPTTLSIAWKIPNKPLLNTHPRVPMKRSLEGLVSNFMASQDARLSEFEADFKRQQGEMTNKINTVLKAITDRIVGALPSDMVKNPKLSTSPVSPDEGQEKEGNLGNTNSSPHPQPDPLASITTEQVRKLNSMLESLGLVPQSSNMKFICSKEDDGEVIFIEIIRDDNEPQNKGPNEGKGATTEGPTVEYFDTFPTRDEITYHKYLMCGPIPSIFLQNPIIKEGCPSNLNIPCNIGHVHVEKANIDL